MNAYRVSGKFRMGHILSPFSLETVANDDEGARDRIFATIGSRHRVARRQIQIEKVTRISADEVTDAVVEKRLSMVK